MAIVEKHEGKVDLKSIGGFTEVELKEIHVSNSDESMEDMNLHFVMEDKAHNKRVMVINLDHFDDYLREFGFKLERED